MPSKKKITIAMTMAAASFVLLADRAGNAAISGFANFASFNNNGVDPSNTIGYSPDGSTFTLTDGTSSEATSGYYPVAQNYNSFVASFTYTVPGGNAGNFSQADGFDFVLQHGLAGTSDLGGVGNNRGYFGGGPIPSVAIGFEIYGGSVESYITNASGALASNSVPNLNTANQIGIGISYSGSTLSVTTTDLTSHATSFHTYTGVNLTSLLGYPTAIVGFTGATGGVASTQTISNFHYTSTSPYSPVALTSGSFNQDGVVEASAGGNPAGSITATMDGGTAKTGDTWFEKGAAGSPAGTGLPASGSLFTSASDPGHVFQLQSYTGNNVMLVDTASRTGTMTFQTPEALSALSFLLAAGNGPAPFSILVTYADGAPSSTITGLVAPDWFSGQGAAAALVGSRITATGAYDSASVNPNLYQYDVPMVDSIDPISSVTLDYTGTNTGTQIEVFAISGAVPEPTSLFLLAPASLALLRRRARRA